MHVKSNLNRWATVDMQTVTTILNVRREELLGNARLVSKPFKTCALTRVRLVARPNVTFGSRPANAVARKAVKDMTTMSKVIKSIIFVSNAQFSGFVDFPVIWFYFRG